MRLGQLHSLTLKVSSYHNSVLKSYIQYSDTGITGGLSWSKMCASRINLIINIDSFVSNRSSQVG